ncbi:MAG TPA: 30S ribosomal protein S20 [Bacteroidetes bacterium]|nr:30S ribosomal protein S20 [Bacteroidota bacterium]
MAHHKSAIKRIKTNRKSNLRNRHYRTLMRTSLRRVRESSSPETLQGNLRSACAVLDRLVGKGIIHRNNAARRKSKLHRMVASRLNEPQA